jgi:hypothetical protein
MFPELSNVKFQFFTASPKIDIQVSQNLNYSPTSPKAHFTNISKLHIVHKSISNFTTQSVEIVDKLNQGNS